MPKQIDAVTRKWTRNKADEIAAKNGCRIDLSRGKFTTGWIENYCFLYEGFAEPQLIKLMPFLKDYVMRLFSWVKFSKDHKKDVRRFRKASLWVPKKNAKSVILPCVGLYMLMGEREHGRKCFSVAKDGKQAMIAHNHAIQMVQASEALREECEINKSTGRIAHIPSQSYYQVIAGDNIEGQEGLNANFVGGDETHILDHRLMSVLEYAGISRAEPIQFEVSTAGNNPDGYGKKQFNYGRDVNAGNGDDTFLHQEYAITEDLTDEELDRDIKKIGKSVNPAWGTTVFEGEFLSSYEKSKRSIATFADFKMYRLNLWQQSTSPWIKSSSWQQCVAPELYTARGLCNHRRLRSFSSHSDRISACIPRVKLDAYAALDLSKVYDMTAFVLAIPRKAELQKFGQNTPLWNPNDIESKTKIQLIVRLWLPEMYARMHNHLAPFLKWAEQGYLTLTPGDTMDYTIVRRDIKRLCKHFNVLQCAYDPMYAEQTMQDLTHGVYNSETGELIEEGIGWQRFEFHQRNADYAKPTQDFDGLILDGKLIHPNNPCCNWQAGHVEVAQDTFGNKRPIKPKGAKGDEVEYKKVDAVCASVMSCSLALKADKSHYEHKGIMML